MLKQSKVYKFYEQVKQEAFKVVWPTRKELTTATLVVVAVVIIFSLICLLLDYGLHNLVQFLLKVGH